MIENLLSNDEFKEAGILNILENNIAGNRARDDQRDWALKSRTEPGQLTCMVSDGVSDHSKDCLGEKLADDTIAIKNDVCRTITDTVQPPLEIVPKTEYKQEKSDDKKERVPWCSEHYSQC